MRLELKICVIGYKLTVAGPKLGPIVKLANINRCCRIVDAEKNDPLFQMPFRRGGL
jgi:hypothetical protein